MKWKSHIFLRMVRLQERDQKKMRRPAAQLKLLFSEKIYLLRRDRMERELFHSCVVLKNLAIVHQSLPMSADFMLEQLMEASRPLRNIYGEMLSLYRKGEQDAAFQVISKRIPTKASRDFARILSKLDYILPSDLVLQMDGFEETFSAERKTKAMARAERKSLITTLTSTATVFAVLLNFTVVVIFLDTMRILGRLF